MKRITILLSVSVLILGLPLSAQDTTSVEGPWKKKGMASLNFSQVSLTNWSQGGESSYAVNAMSAFSLNYLHDRTSWDNTMDIGYGIQKIGEKDPGKTDDHFELISKYGRKTSDHWYVSGMINLKSQFTKGFQPTDAGDIVISDFLSPGYILISLGMEYKPNDSFFVSLSPVSGKVTIVINDSLSGVGAYGLEPGNSTRSEFGGSVKAAINMEIMKNVTLTSTLDLFSNYLNNPLNIDISWKAMINMKVNELLSATISTHLLYDDDIDYVDGEGVSQGPKVQFKEMLGVGFSYKF